MHLKITFMSNTISFFPLEKTSNVILCMPDWFHHWLTANAKPNCGIQQAYIFLCTFSIWSISHPSCYWTRAGIACCVHVYSTRHPGIQRCIVISSIARNSYVRGALYSGYVTPVEVTSRGGEAGRSSSRSTPWTRQRWRPRAQRRTRPVRRSPQR